MWMALFISFILANLEVRASYDLLFPGTHQFWRPSYCRGDLWRRKSIWKALPLCPSDVGTTPVFHNYLKGGRPASNPGLILDDGTLRFGNQVSSVILAFPLVSDVCSVCTQQPGTPLELRSWPKLYNFSIVCSFISSMFVLNINI